MFKDLWFANVFFFVFTFYQSVTEKTKKRYKMIDDLKTREQYLSTPCIEKFQGKILPRIPPRTDYYAQGRSKKAPLSICLFERNFIEEKNGKRLDCSEHIENFIKKFENKNCLGDQF